jgi:hypothetical protein
VGIEKKKKGGGNGEAGGEKIRGERSAEVLSNNHADLLKQL